ncbi:MAG: phenylacetate-CoA oxygenase subunit PaaJ [Candidatus Kapabacteria bacterium]|nr:phenylacetate-CoA oxygenase subunit PaaJ [Candidatus Kapabacteria bacterium]
MKEDIKKIVLDTLSQISDPEIPVVNIIEMGMIRDIKIEEGEIKVLLTPTYSGCPAMRQIEDDILFSLGKKGFSDVTIETVLSPAWTTDWLSEGTKEKLKKYGIAPPVKNSSDNIFNIISTTQTVNCPFCDSSNTDLKSFFGSTACKSLYYCNNCQQPFEHFKCH